MKYLLSTIMILATALSVDAQEYKIAHNGGKLILVNVNNVEITAYDGSEVIINAAVERNEEEAERAKGLKAINSLGLDDNTGLGLSVQKEDGNVIVTQIGDMHEDGEYTIQLPKSMALDYSHNTYNSEHLLISGVTKEIIVSTNYTNVELDNVTGPMSVKTVYGSIDAAFTSLNQESSVSLNSVYSHVDVTVPGSSKANLKLKTPYGQIYTDMDINVTAGEDGMKNVSSKRVSGTINGGGVDFIIQSGYDNIYLRKK